MADFVLADYLKDKQLKATTMTEDGGGGKEGSLADARMRVRAAISARHREIYLGNKVNTDLLLHVVNDALAREVDLSFNTKAQLRQEILTNARGVGPILAPYLDDPEVTEVRVIQGRKLLVVRYGKGGYEEEPENTWFADEEELLQTIIHLFQHRGRSITTERPCRTVKLDDGSRVAAAIPPAVLHPMLVIRKPPDPRRAVTVDQLLAWGAMSEPEAFWLEYCGRVKLNVVITGPMNAGKTTLIRAIGRGIPEDEMVATIEDTLEIDFPRDRLDQMEAVAVFGEGAQPVTMHDLFVFSLRGSYSRVIQGEARENVEGMDYVQTSLSGQGGNLTSVHADGPVEVLKRLAIMVTGATNIPFDQAVGLVTSAVDVIVHAYYYPDNSRKVASISCLARDVYSAQEIEGALQPLFRFESTGRDPDGKILGEHRQVGVLPERVVDKLRRRGYDIPEWLLRREVDA